MKCISCKKEVEATEQGNRVIRYAGVKYAICRECLHQEEERFWRSVIRGMKKK